MKRELTATVFIIEHAKVLLLYHLKFKKWTPPGGHIDPNELPTEGAVREVLEETGLHVQLVSDEPVWYSDETTQSLVRPYRCFVYNIPHMGDELPHQHVDFVYVAKVVGGVLKANLKEMKAVRWFSRDEVERIPFGETFENTREMILSLLPDYSHTRSLSR